MVDWDDPLPLAMVDWDDPLPLDMDDWDDPLPLVMDDWDDWEVKSFGTGLLFDVDNCDVDVDVDNCGTGYFGTGLVLATTLLSSSLTSCTSCSEQDWSVFLLW